MVTILRLKDFITLKVAIARGRFSLQQRLFGAVAIIAFMSLAGTGIGWLAYDRLGRSISSVTGNEIPRLELMNDVASLSLQIRAEAPLIIAAESDTEVANVTADLNALIDSFNETVARLNVGRAESDEAGAKLNKRAQDLIEALQNLESSVRRRAVFAINLAALTARSEEAYRNFKRATTARGGDLGRIELLTANLAQYLADGASAPTPLMVGKFLLLFRGVVQEVSPIIDSLPETHAAIAARTREIIAFGTDDNGMFALRHNLLQAHDDEKTALKVTMSAADRLVADTETAVAAVHKRVQDATDAAEQAQRAGNLSLQILALSSIVVISFVWFERKAAAEEIANLAFYDQLTRLPNRRLMNDRLKQMLAASKRHGRYAALMLLDMDNFKSLNDTHGHQAGDLLLIEVARRASSCIRETDTAARLGGDEFVVILSELDGDKSHSTRQAGYVAEKIRSILAEPYILTVEKNGVEETLSHDCTPSIGVTLFIDSRLSPQDILKQADAAMYRAKNAGKNKVCFYETAS
jgi:diguanylate cyclase (GGDEF)-like protein